MCGWLVGWLVGWLGVGRGGGLANFLATHHPQPFPEQNDKCCLVHPAVTRQQTRENILLLLTTQRKYTCGTRTGAHREFLKQLPHFFFSTLTENKPIDGAEVLRAGGLVLLRELTTSEMSGVVNNSSSFVEK